MLGVRSTSKGILSLQGRERALRVEDLLTTDLHVISFYGLKSAYIRNCGAALFLEEGISYTVP